MSKNESEWQVNGGDGLKPRMIIRLSGQKSELGQVYKVVSGQATYKDNTGKSVTIPASAEVEFRWPKQDQDTKSDKSAETDITPASPQPVPEDSDPTITATPDNSRSKSNKAKSKPKLDREVDSHAAKMAAKREAFNKKREEKAAAAKAKEQEAPFLIEFEDEEAVEVQDQEIESAEDSTTEETESNQPVDEQEVEPETDNKSAELEEEEKALMRPDSLHTVEDLSEKTGRTIANINALRRDGTIPESMYEKRGKAYLYQRQVGALIKDLPKPTRGRKPGSSNKSTNRASERVAAKSTSSTLISLPQIAEQLGVAYPSLARLARLHEDELPSEGSGRNRKFYPEAIKILERLKGDSKPGRKTGSVKATAGNTDERKARKAIFPEAAAFSASSSRSLRPVPSFLQHPSISKEVSAAVSGLESLIAQFTAERERLDNLIETLTEQRSILTGV